MKVKLWNKQHHFRMLSPADLERLITAKKRELQKEKIALGLSPPPQKPTTEEYDKENSATKQEPKPKRQVNFENKILTEHNGQDIESDNKDCEKSLQDLKEEIPPDLERYIRRYLGLPVMLKAGEFSPNNPLLRSTLPRDRDAFLGLGEYEQRSKTLRKLRQREYKEYLDQQAKKKQEEKERAEKERREREKQEAERERLLLERENQQQLIVKESEVRIEREGRENRRALERDGVIRVDTGVQVNGWKQPLSVAVQTDDCDLFRLLPSTSKLTEAERELSPRTVLPPRRSCDDDRPLHPAATGDKSARRRSYGDHVERPANLLRKSNRDKLVSDLRHTYMPSIFDADAIQTRNEKVEQEAAERRHFYQQELKNQIQEQQRIREERKAREMMLEKAEMRRLEDQLRMLKVAQEREYVKNDLITDNMKENAFQFEKKKTSLQKEIDDEQKSLFRAVSQPSQTTQRNIYTSRSENSNTKSHHFYPKIENNLGPTLRRPPFSMNIPENSIFSQNYDVDNYLRRNLNPSKENLMHRFKSDYTKSDVGFKDNFSYKTNIEEYDINKMRNQDLNLEQINENSRRFSFKPNISEENEATKQVFVENALIHDAPTKFKQRDVKETNKNQSQDKRTIASRYEPSFLRKDPNDLIVKLPVDETLPIPVLRHSPDVQLDKGDIEIGAKENNSDKMKKIEDKWKVPAVQKNYLKSLPSNDGKNVSILTQLGSIRRQLQLEQLKLDKMLPKNTNK